MTITIVILICLVALLIMSWILYKVAIVINKNIYHVCELLEDIYTIIAKRL
jgi:hypothetical protein